MEKKDYDSLSAFERLLKPVQLLSILVAGCWVVWQYFDHDRDAAKLAVERQKIDNNQVKTLAGIQRDAQRISRDQQLFTLRQATMLAENERKSKEIYLKQQEFTYRQAVATASSERDRQRFSAKLSEIEFRSKASELKFNQRGRIKSDLDLSVKCIAGQPGRYTAILSVSIANTSETPVEVSWTFTRVFFGKLTPVLKGNLTAINQLPFEFDEPSNYPVDWQQTSSEGHIYPGREELLNILPFTAKAGKGATGSLLKDYSNGDALKFLVSGNPGDRVGVTFLFGLDRQTVDENGTVYRPDRTPIVLGRETRAEVEVFQFYDDEPLPDCKTDQLKT